jgi:hypothetical protein
MRTSLIAPVAAALAILAGGCAGAGAQGPGSADGAATVVPSDAVAFVAASTDLTSSQWHGLGTLALKELQASDAELQALADGEVDVALLQDGKAVAFVQPKDDAKLAAFANRHHRVLRRFGDWTGVAADAATLDAVASAKAHLADNTLFLDAMNHLPDDALVRAYANGEEAHTLFASIPGQLESRQIPTGARYRLKRERSRERKPFGVGTLEFPWLAAAVTSSDAGLRLEIVAPRGELTAPGPPRLAVQPIAPYASALVDEIPSGVLAVVDFQVPESTFELMPELPAALPKLFGSGGLDLASRLDAILGGETAIYVRPGFPMPEITLVTEPSDTSKASATLDELLAGAPKDGPLASLRLHRAVLGGQFVVSTTQKGIDDFSAGGRKLSADPSFLEAGQRVGMPPETTGFVYVNAHAAVPLLALAGVKLPVGMPDVTTFAAFGARRDNLSTFTAFLGVS